MHLQVKFLAQRGVVLEPHSCLTRSVAFVRAMVWGFTPWQLQYRSIEWRLSVTSVKHIYLDLWKVTGPNYIEGERVVFELLPDGSGDIDPDNDFASCELCDGEPKVMWKIRGRHFFCHDRGCYNAFQQIAQGPKQPNASDRRRAFLERMFGQRLIAEAICIIAECLHYWFED